MITAMVMSYNNEELILRALSCLYKFDEIILVDNGSTDRTVEVARSMGVKIAIFPLLTDFSRRRNDSIRQATNNHVFWLDSDEIINPEAYEDIKKLFEENDSAVIGFKRLNCFNIKSYVTGWYPDVQLRAYHRDRCVYQGEVHNVLQKRKCKQYESKYNIIHGLFYNVKRYDKDDTHLKYIRKKQGRGKEYNDLISQAKSRPQESIKNLKGVV